jgi:hypothetical protein
VRRKVYIREGIRFLTLAAALCVTLFTPSAVLPPTSSEIIRQRVGVYVWGRVPDLSAAILDVQRIGADRVVRTFIGPWSDTPPYEDDLRPLDEKATSPAFQAMFRAFPVTVLTAYDSFSYGRIYGNSSVRVETEISAPGGAAQSGPRHPADPSLGLVKQLAAMTPAEAEELLGETHDEFRRFAFELAKLDRTFIVSNWEAEQDVPDASYWPWFTRYLQARLDGIVAGRNAARQMGYPARVFTAFEFTIVPGFAGRPSGLVEIGGQLRGLDYLSYSSWWSIGWDYDAATMKNSFRYAIQLIRGFAAQAGLPQQLIIGEFGEYWNLHPRGERLKAIVDVSIEEGVEYLFNWALYEQPGEKDEWGRDASHFGKYFLDRRLTPQGRAFQAWFQRPAVFLPVPPPPQLP